VGKCVALRCTDSTYFICKRKVVGTIASNSIVK
jgi:hypothetical protein